MQQRLLLSTLTVVLAAFILFGIPLAFVLDRVVHEDAQARLLHDASRVARELQSSNSVDDPAALSDALIKLVPTDDTVIMQYPNGRQAVAESRQHHAITATVD